MTCSQLGGACQATFRANSFDGMAKQSKAHAMDMLARGDKPHLVAMKKMEALMNSPDAMRLWFQQKQKEFDELPDHE